MTDTKTKYGPRTITTMRIPDDILEAMDEAASTARLTRTEWLVKLLYEHLGLEPQQTGRTQEPSGVFG